MAEEIELERYCKVMSYTYSLFSKSKTADCNHYDQEKFGKVQITTTRTRDGFSLYKKVEANLLFVAGNIINAIIGSGIIALPVSFAYSGMGMSAILLAISAIMGDFTILCLCVLNTLTNKFTYQQAVKESLGSAGYFCCALFQFFFSYSAIASYGIASADNFIQISNHLWPSKEWLVYRPMVALFYIVPVMIFSFYENVARLGILSLTSITCVFVYVILIFYRSFGIMKHVMVLPDTYTFIKPKGIPLSFSVIAFAMSCQQTVGRIYHSMEDRSIKRFSIATHLSSVTSLIFYLFVAIIGFVSFGGNVQANLLQNYCPDDTIALIARCAFTITLLLSSPMQVICARESITTIISKFGIRRKKLPTILVLITLLILTTCYCIAAFVLDLGLVLSLSGSAVAANMVFTFPALSLFVYLRKIGYHSRWLNLGLIFVILFGISIMFIGVITTLYKTSQSHTEMIKYWCHSAYTPINNTVIIP